MAELSTMEGMVPEPTVTPTDAPRTGRVYPEHFETEAGGTLLPKLSYNVTTDEVRRTGAPVPGLVEDIWESMKKLSAGIPDVESFNPQDTLNVAGLAMTGGLARMATAEAGGLGAFGGKLANKTVLRNREGLEYQAREVYSDPNRAEFRIAGSDGRKVGEYSVTRSTVPGKMTIDNIVVNKDFRRQGIAEAAYDDVAQQFGKENITPSETLQEGTYRMWEKRNPELLAAGKYVKEEDGWVRTDHTFSTYKNKGTLTRNPIDVSKFPDQAVLNFREPVQTIRRETINRVKAGDDLTSPPLPGSGIDVSYTVPSKIIPEDTKKGALKLLENKGSQTLEMLKKEMPDLQYSMEKSGRSVYIQVSKEGEPITRFRLSDHAATSFDSISIDPVSANTPETLLQVLRYERGITDQAPEIGWSFLPPGPLRKALNKQAGMDLFPEDRQIGGKAEYLRGGYSADQTPYRVKSHTVGTDIQWKFDQLDRAAE